MQNLTWLIILLGIALGVQIVLFIWGRRIRKKEKENSVIEKYDIRSRQKAWQLLADPELPEEDRKKIEELFQDKA